MRLNQLKRCTMFPMMIKNSNPTKNLIKKDRRKSSPIEKKPDHLQIRRKKNLSSKLILRIKITNQKI